MLLPWLLGLFPWLLDLVEIPLLHDVLQNACASTILEHANATAVIDWGVLRRERPNLVIRHRRGGAGQQADRVAHEMVRRRNDWRAGKKA